MLCARECPDWCIYIDSHKEELPPTTPGGRARQRNVLDRFAIDFSLCMYCGICIEVCPFDALHWSPEFEYAELDIRDLIHEKDRLGAWMATVPAPPALDPGSADPAEVVAAAKPPRGAAAAGGTRGAAAAARPTRVRPESTPTTTATPAAEQTRVMPAVERTAALPVVDPTTTLPPADGAEAEAAADQAAAQGDSTQVLPTVSTDEEGRE
jgi:NADH-quinone oxidoreductase subunit I